MRLKFTVCVLLGVFLSDFSGAVVFRFTNYVCKSYNESWFIFNHCRLKAISREKVVLNLNGTLLHAVYNVHVHFKMFKKANGFKPWLMDVKVDVCRFLKKSYNPFGKIIFSLFKEFSNFNHTCPFVGQQIIKGFYLKPELLNLPMPTGEYMLAMRWFLHQKLVMDSNASFMFVEDMRA